MEESTYVENIPCPECGSELGVGVYQREDGEYYGNCFNEACAKYIKDPYGEGGAPDPDEFKSIKKESFTMQEVSKGSINKLETRGISKEACSKYKILSIVESGYDTVHYYPHTKDGKVSSYMRRIVDTKSFKSNGDTKGLEFFGQSEAGSGGKMIIVTEGQLDAAAAFDMLKKCGKNYRVVSIVNGSSSAVKCFKTNYEWINTFDNIFLAFDQDEPGQIAAEKVGALFEPNRVKNIKFSEKDANDLSVKGKHHEFLSAIFNAKESRPDGIVSVEDIFDEAIKPPVMGMSWPWDTLTDVTYGYRRGEIYGIGAGSGAGKTEAFKEMINHTINVHGLAAGVIFLEEPAAKTLKVLAGKKVNKRFHIPADKGGDWTIDELKEGINDLKGKVYLYNHFGSKDWASISSKIRYMVISLGIKDIYLDHLTALVAQEDNEYKALNRIMEEMSSLCQELDCTIFYISHLRKASGTPHEEGGHVSADQFKGSGAIVFWSNFLFGIERDQQAEDVDDRNTATFRVLKDRNTGLATGVTFQLRYDHKTGRWDEFDDSDTFDEEDF